MVDSSVCCPPPPHLINTASSFYLHVHQTMAPRSGVLFCRHTKKPDPRAMQSRAEINVADPDTQSPLPFCDWDIVCLWVSYRLGEAGWGKMQLRPELTSECCSSWKRDVQGPYPLKAHTVFLVFLSIPPLL